MELKGPILPDKDFFTMGEVCRLVQVPPHTLRYWESQVGFLRPARRASGHRRYTRADVETIVFLKERIQRRRMTLAGARRALLELRKGPQEAPQDAGESQAQGLPAPTLKLLREVRKEIQALVQELKS